MCCLLRLASADEVHVSYDSAIKHDVAPHADGSPGSRAGLEVMHPTMVESFVGRVFEHYGEPEAEAYPAGGAPATAGPSAARR